MIVAGFGFTTRATMESLEGALAAAGTAPEALATLADKAATLAPLAEKLNLPLIPVSGPLPDTETHSPASFYARGTGSVAEATALAAAGPGAFLLASRVISPDRLATCAIAQGVTP
ncbi:MAG: cobalamin biosynthesis protein [Pararhodobacter sp.]